MMAHRWTAVLVVGSLLVGACGGSESEGTASTDSSVVPTSRTVVTAGDAGADVQSSVATSGADEEQSTAEFVFGLDEVVRFEAGGTSATVSGAVVRGERSRYSLEAAAGQTLNVDITSLEDNAVFDIWGPDDVLLASEAMTASVVLPANAEYRIIVGGTRGNASYDMVIEIPAN